MLIYWLLFAFPALVALIYPVNRRPAVQSGGQTFGLVLFVIFYALIGGLRFETGGDWGAYLEMFEYMSSGSLGEAIAFSDPLFGVLNWVSGELGTGLMLVNGVCSLILGIGVVRVSARMSEPWMGVLFAVPYLLIVVGMGYIRQGAAIGLILCAIVALDRSRPVVTIVYLLLAAMFHSSASLVIPIFGWALVKRNKAVSIVLLIAGSVAFSVLFAPRIDAFEYGYLDQEYDSSGTATRLMMSLIPSILVLARWRHFKVDPRVRSVWIAVSLANFVALAALAVTPSTTAVDRIALYFAIIQIAGVAEFRSLTGISNTMTMVTRVVLIGLAAAIQSVFLIFATHASLWVPYQSIFSSQ